MKISVVIPAYNAEKYLAATLDSVLSQSVSSWELVIVDDGSTDSTPQIARDYGARDARIRVVAQKNGGVAAARNCGFSQSAPGSEFVIFLDQDDLWEPDTLADLSKALEANSGAVAVHGLARFIDGNGALWRPGEAEEMSRNRLGVAGKKLENWNLGQSTNFAVLAYRNCIWTPGQVLIRRAFLEEVGAFDSQTVPCDDWDMWLRLTRHGEIEFLDKIVLNFRRHDKNQSSDDKKLRRAEIAMRRKLQNAPDLTDEQKRTARRGYQLCERYSANLRLRFCAENLRKRRPVAALKELVHATILYSRSLSRGQIK